MGDSNLSPGTGPEYVVGVGASAGGLEALERLFDRMPADTGMAFVVIQHLSPDFKSLMDELLGRRTAMPVRRAENEMVLEANHVYLLPPRKEMIVADGRLLLTEKSREGLSLPIDHFLRSLSQEYGHHAIAVILSGTGSDGSRGVQEISAAGGLVLAQTERTSRFDGMPAAARATGAVDLSLDPEDIPNALLTYVERPDIDDLTATFQTPTSDEDGLTAIFRLLRDQFGIDFSHYKLNTVVRRTERRLQLNQLDSISAYLQQLRDQPGELDALYRDLLVEVTRFFRDSEAFDELAVEIDRVIELMAPQSEFRAWVAGCATGEEAYTVAILLHERIAKSGKSITARVFASDVHPDSLEIAGRGFYTGESLKGMRPERLKRYFIAEGDGYFITKEVRQSVVFATHNVFKDAPFTRMDLITCRNLLIYLQPSAQKKALSLFHFGLKTGGLLLLGPSETPGELSDEFESLHDHWKIYRKSRDVRLAIELRDPSTPKSERPLRNSGLPEIQPPVNRPPDMTILGAYDALLADYMPEGLLIDERNHILHTFGDAGRFVLNRSGRFSPDVVDHLDPRVRLGLAAAIRQARASLQEVRLRRLILSTNQSAEERVDVTVRPVLNERSGRTNAVLLFDTNAAPAQLPTPVEPTDDALDEVNAERIEALETELSHARENLQALVEELETSNEELQATNEELVASNEELQSTNEELHSVNEELHTVNAEYQKKIAQLTEMTDDMENLYESTQVHTVYLDTSLNIRKFTPEMAAVFNLIRDDVGRPIAGFKSRLRRDDLVGDLRKVLETREPLIVETRDEAGQWFLMRVFPYETDAGTEGVVLTLVDIDDLKAAERELREVQGRLQRTLLGSQDGFWEWKVDSDEMHVSPRLPELLGCSAEKFEPTVECFNSCLPEAERDRLWKKIRGHLNEHTSAQGDDRFFEVQIQAPREDEPDAWLHIRGQSFEAPDGSARVSGSIRDVTDRVRAERAARRNAEELRLVTNNVPVLISYVDASLNYRYVNRNYEQLFAANADEIIGKSVRELLGEEAFQHLLPRVTQALSGESVVYSDVLRRPGSDDFHFQASYVPDVDEVGNVVGFYATISDVTELNQLLEERQTQIAQRDMFLATLSHELRNPLGAVANAVQLLKLSASDEKTAEIVGSVGRQIAHMKVLLQDLLDVARVTEGKIELARRPVMIRDVIEQTLESVNLLFEVRGQEATVEATVEATDDGWVSGDADRLRQIFTNLLTNAAKYSPVGGRTRVVVERAEDALRGAVIRVRVKDDGLGIEPDSLETIFDPFKQIGNKIDRVAGGLGLGLTLSRTLAELHSATLTAQSEGVGHGSEFVLTIPAIEPPGDEVECLDVSEPEPATSRISIVVVDDHSDALRTLASLLREFGHVVRTSADGYDGLQLIRAAKPDLALIDIGLPGMDGYAIVRAVREEPEYDGVHLAALTGYGLASDQEEARRAGFDTHLTKPLDFQSLQKLIARIAASNDAGETRRLPGSLLELDDDLRDTGEL